jgi:subtilisin family serine protease
MFEDPRIAHRALYRLLLAALFVASVQLQAPARAATQAGQESDESTDSGAVIPGELIVKYRPGIQRTGVRVLASGVALSPLSELGLIGATLVSIPPDALRAVLAELARDPEVEYAEPNRRVSIDRYPSDPEFPLLWGLNNVGQTGGQADADIDALEAWDVATGDSIIVGVIDSGVDTAHADLRANIWTNPGEVAGNGVDDEGNGFVDDVHGWDFLQNDNDPADANGHGTHVAGTIAARGDNGQGIAGVLWSARIMPLRFLNADGQGSTAHAVLALGYAVKMGARLTCNSWGGTGYSQALRDAIDSAGRAGQLFVSAAGNVRTNLDVQPHYPAAYDADCIIAVAASDHFDRLASEPTWGTNYGALRVDLAAPGVNVYSTVPGGGYDFKSGTSMAAPHVAGAAALLWSVHPGLSATQVKARLLATVDRRAEMRGKFVSEGRLNIHAALSGYDVTPPAAVTDLRVAAVGGSRVTLAFTAPGDDGTKGQAAAYEVVYSTQPIDDSSFASAFRADVRIVPRPAGQPETVTVIGLEFDTPYYFALQSVDEWFNRSGTSNQVSARTLGPPRAVAAPDVLCDSLDAGGSALENLYLTNLGAGELPYDVRIDFPYYDTDGHPGTGDEPDLTSTSDSSRDRGVTHAASATASGGRRVLLIYADDGALGTRQLLLAYPDIAEVDLWPAPLGGGTIPSFDIVRAYDVVIAWNNRIWADAYAIGQLLATCIDSGVAVVTATDAWGTNQFASRGRYFDSTGYSPLRAAGPARFDVRRLGAHLAHHPIMRGVGDLAIGSYYNDVDLTPGAKLVASWDDGTPLVATNPHTVAINVWPGDGYHWIGDFAELLHNAVRYADGDFFWLTTPAQPGELLSNDSRQLALKFDASQLSEGLYSATVVVTSNDPVEPELAVPVTLRVRGTPRFVAGTDAVDFGDVFSGYTSARAISVRNGGTGLLSVTASLGSGSPFTVEPADLRIPPGGDSVLTVTFAPLVPGPAGDSLVLASNDPASGRRAIALSGTGALVPVAAVAPGALAAALYVGGRARDSLAVTNHGSGPLEFAIRTRGARPPSTYGASAAAAPDDSVDVLLWSRYGDESPTGEVGRTVAALEKAFPLFRLTRTDITDPGTLESLLHDRDVLILPEQENALPELLVMAGSWRSVLSDFVYTGGTVIFCQEWGNSDGFVNATGLMQVASHDRGSGAPLDRVMPTHPLLDGVSDSLVGTNLTAWYDVASPDAQVVVAEADSGRPVVVERPWGSGHVVLLGFDYFTFNDDMARILGNAVRYGQDKIGWLEPLPRAGSVPPGATRTVSVVMRADALAGGEFSADLEVTTDDPQNRRFHVPVALHVTDAPHIVFDRDTLPFGEVYLGGARTETLTVSNAGTRPLSITAVSLPDGAFSAPRDPFTLAVAARRRLPVTFTPSLPGVQELQLQAASNDPDEAVLTAVLVGTGVVPPEAAVEPASLAEALVTGERAGVPIRIKNDGGSELRFSVHARIGNEPAGPATAVWRPRVPLPRRLSDHALVAHPNGKIYSLGGFQNSLGAVAQVYIYDPATDRWSTGASRPAPDRGMAAAVGQDGRIYTFSSTYPLSAGYDPALDLWSPIPSPPIDQVREAAAATGPDGRIYLIGGEGVSANDPLPTLQIFDPPSQSWTIGPPVPTARYQAEMVCARDGRLYVLGGRTGFAEPPLDLVEIFDPAKARWEAGPPMPAPRAHFAAAVGADGRIYVLGGKNAYVHNEGTFFATSDVYDPRTRTWSTGPPLPGPLGECAAAPAGGSVFVAGGSNGTERAETWLLGVPRWLAVSPDTGRVPALSAFDLQAVVDATGLSSGSFAGALAFQTNDPRRPAIELPVTIDVMSAPDLVVTTDSVDFGAIFAGFARERIVRVGNEGFAPLAVTVATRGDDEFSADLQHAVVAPGKAISIAVRFASATPGSYSGGLILATDDPDTDTVRVALMGRVIGAPLSSVAPASFDLALEAGRSTVRPIVIRNSGVSPLQWAFSDLTPAPVRPAGGGALAADLADGLSHLGGVRIGFMEYPGTDPNSWIKADLRARGAEVVDVPFPFLPAMLRDLDILAVDFWVARASTESVDSVRAWLARGGGLLLAASGSIYDPVFTQLLAGSGVTLYRSEDTARALVDILPHAVTRGVDSVASAGDRAFCEASGSARAVVRDGRGRTHALVTTLGPGRLCVVGNRLYANANLEGHGTRLFTNRIFDWLATGTTVEADPLEGTVEAGAEDTVMLRFDAGTLIGGTYEPAVTLYSNDPATPARAIAVRLEVTGAPAIGVSADSLAFDTSYVGYAATRVLHVYNRGTAPLSVTAQTSDAGTFALDPAAFAVPVFESRDIQVTLRAADTGLASATLTLASDAPLSPVVNVALTGYAIPPPRIRVSPDTLRLQLSAGESLKTEVEIDNVGMTLLAVAFDTEADDELPPGVLCRVDAALKATAPIGFGSSPDAEAGAIPTALTSPLEPVWPVSKELGERPSSSRAQAAAAEYTGEFVSFGITDRGEVWPFLYPGDTSQVYSSGYLVAYRTGGVDHVKSVWYGLGRIIPTGFRELVNDSVSVKAEFTGRTDDGLLGLVRRFTFERRRKYVTVETELVNLGQLNMDDVVFKCWADFDIDATYANDSWNYDRAHHLVYGKDRRFMGIAGRRAPDFMDIEGRDDAGQRPTHVNFASGPVNRYDGMPLLHFERGRLKPGGSARIMVTIAAGDSLADLQAETARGLQRVKWLAVDTTDVQLPPRSAFTLGIVCDAADLYGGDYRAGLIFASNDPATPEVRIPVRLHVDGTPVLAVGSDTLDFGTAYPGYPVTRQVVVRNRGTDVLQVSGIDCDLGAVAVDARAFSLWPGTDTALTVTLMPVAPGPLEGTLTITSNDTTLAQYVILVRAQILLPPSFSVSPESVLVAVRAGDSQTVAVRIANGGPGILTWSVQAAAEPPASPFSLYPVSGTLAAGAVQDATLVIRTSGLASGMHSREVRFAHNDPALPSSRIAVSIDVFTVMRGDANADRAINARDIIYLVNNLWDGGPDPYGMSGDLNCDSVVSLADIIMLINYVFKSGPAPSC